MFDNTELFHLLSGMSAPAVVACLGLYASSQAFIAIAAISNFLVSRSNSMKLDGAKDIAEVTAGRVNGHLEALRTSLAEKDAIIADLTARNPCAGCVYKASKENAI